MRPATSRTMSRSSTKIEASRDRKQRTSEARATAALNVMARATAAQYPVCLPNGRRSVAGLWGAGGAGAGGRCGRVRCPLGGRFEAQRADGPWMSRRLRARARTGVGPSPFAEQIADAHARGLRQPKDDEELADEEHRADGDGLDSRARLAAGAQPADDEEAHLPAGPLGRDHHRGGAALGDDLAPAAHRLAPRAPPVRPRAQPVPSQEARRDEREQGALKQLDQRHRERRADKAERAGHREAEHRLDEAARDVHRHRQPHAPLPVEERAQVHH
mmetsp:Transcript_61403/g.162717  ORF Transcript_61403/g.162717 Transcript_61403/m.162717 type:complete len:274 (+) Transcript_61403:513-1334(+)